MAQSRDSLSVLGIAHTGITVRSLEQSLAFWHDLLRIPVVYRNTLQGEVASRIVCVEDVRIDTALLQFPNGMQLELLQYRAPDDKTEYQPRPCDVGNVHLALEVVNIAALIEAAKPLGWIAGDVQRFRRGDGSFWAMIYMRSQDGQTVELMERLEEHEQATVEEVSRA